MNLRGSTNRKAIDDEERAIDESTKITDANIIIPLIIKTSADKERIILNISTENDQIEAILKNLLAVRP